MDFSLPKQPHTFSHYEKSLKIYFDARLDIHFAIIFGSYAKEKNHPFSDLDIGVHLKEELSLLDLGSMIEDLESTTNGKIDLLVLNDLFEENSSLAYEIICKHKLICNHSEKIYVQFKTKTYLHYFDDEPLREMKRKSLQKRIESNQFGRTNFVNKL